MLDPRLCDTSSSGT